MKLHARIPLIAAMTLLLGSCVTPTQSPVGFPSSPGQGGQGMMTTTGQPGRIPPPPPNVPRGPAYRLGPTAIIGIENLLRDPRTGPPATQSEIVKIRELLDFKPPRLRMPTGVALIAEAQEHLRLLGLYEGDITGVTGAQTASAVLRFQRSTGMKQTGVVTPDLVDLLRRTVATVAPSQAVDLSDPLISAAVVLRATAAANAALLPKLYGSTVPGLDEITDTQESLVWSWFFRGSTIYPVSGGPTPVTGFYNPFVDSWVFTAWRCTPSPCELVASSVSTTDGLLGADGLDRSPHWMTAAAPTLEDALLASRARALTALFGNKGLPDGDGAAPVLLRGVNTIRIFASSISAREAALMTQLRQALSGDGSERIPATAGGRRDLRTLMDLPLELTAGLEPYVLLPAGPRSSMLAFVNPKAGRWMILAALGESGIEAVRFFDLEAPAVVAAGLE